MPMWRPCRLRRCGRLLQRVGAHWHDLPSQERLSIPRPRELSPRFTHQGDVAGGRGLIRCAWFCSGGRAFLGAARDSHAARVEARKGERKVRTDGGKRNEERSSALWGTGNRGGETRSNALWGKGGRGFVTALVAALAVSVPLASSSNTHKHSKLAGASAHRSGCPGLVSVLQQPARKESSSLRRMPVAKAMSTKQAVWR